MFGRLALTLLVALAVSACTQQRGNRLGTGTHWHTKVYRGMETESKDAGQKSIAHTSMTGLSAERARVTVTLPGLLPQGEYAWGLFTGSCDGSLIGGASDYPLIVPDTNSRGSFTATLDGNFNQSGDYFLKIFENGGERNSMLGCSRMRIGTEDDAEAA